MTQVLEQLVRVGRRFDERGWVMGTSGNFSVVIGRDPLRLAITPSAAFKGELQADQILEMDDRGAPVDALLPLGPASTRPRVSAEALLHLEIVRARGAGAVLHTHSIWATLLSERFAGARGFFIEGYEMLKGLEGVRTHEHREWLPIVENDQDMARLSASCAACSRSTRRRMDSCCAGTDSTPGGTICPRPSATSRFWSSCWRSLGEALSFQPSALSQVPDS